MGASMAGVALAAGAGSRLAPITDSIPKPLCTVAGRPLLDLALDRLATVGAESAVNVHHHADQIAAAVGARAVLSREEDEALGTAGGVAKLRSFIDGRPVVVVNGDTWCAGGLEPLVRGWDGETVRVFVPGGGPFGPRSAIVGTLLPWRVVRDLAVVPTGLYEVVWRDEHRAGRLEVVRHDGPWVDCGSAADLLDANLQALRGRTVVHDTAQVQGAAAASAVGEHAVVRGAVSSSVLFPHTVVDDHEVLDRVIRWCAADGTQHTIQL